MFPDESGKPKSTLPENLQFERAEPAEPGSNAPACAACQSALTDTYYAWNGYPICSRCAQRNEFAAAEQSTSRDFLRAALYGTGAALAGTALYFAVRALSGYEIGLLAVAVGWMVGKAVQKGSRGLGGRKFQVLAVVLTYFSIAGSYAPLILRQAWKEPPSSQAASNTMEGRNRAEAEPARAPRSPLNLVIFSMILFFYCLAIPFFQGAGSIIGLFIIGIGLFEAWRLNKRTSARMEGPYSFHPADGNA